jgi:sugar diacid utilization regulator
MSWFFTRYANKDNAIKLQNQMMNFMLTDLLHGIIPSEDTLKRVLGNLSFKTDRELILICVRTSLSEGSDNFEEAKRLFMSFFEDSFSFTQSADIFILTSPSWLLPKNKSIQKKFTSLLKDARCYAGISSTFYSIDKFFIHHFSRALAAADVAMQIKEKQRWTDFRAVSLLAIQSNNYASAIHFCDPALIKLVEYDKAHESDNLYTLCCYWQLNRDIGRICNFLHIHKNTLYYRLRKIASILRQDINDYDNFIQLSLSIAILENLGSIPRYRIFDDDRRQSKWSIQEDYEEE